MLDFKLIRITIEQIDEILNIQSQVYEPKFRERSETFTSKINLSPHTCYGILVEGTLRAYAISFPWSENMPVALDSSLAYHPSKSDTLHIHDVSVDPTYRGRGFAELLIQHLAHDAFSLGLKSLSLVAVQNSSPFWRKFGFVAVSKKVESYGEDSLKMRLALFREVGDLVFRPTTMKDFPKVLEFLEQNADRSISISEQIQVEEQKLNLISPSWLSGILLIPTNQIAGYFAIQKYSNSRSAVECLTLFSGIVSDSVLHELWTWMNIPLKLWNTKTVSLSRTNNLVINTVEGFSKWAINPSTGQLESSIFDSKV